MFEDQAIGPDQYYSFHIFKLYGITIKKQSTGKVVDYIEVILK